MVENDIKASGEFLIPEEELGLLSIKMFVPFTIVSFAIYYLFWKEQFQFKNVITMLDAIEAWSVSFGIGVWWGISLPWPL